MQSTSKLLKIICTKSFTNYKYPQLFIQARLLNYTSKEYTKDKDPSSLFLNPEVQSHLKILTRVDLNYVYRSKKLGQQKRKDPEYKFMTSSQLEAAYNEAKAKAEELLQMPPVIPIREATEKVLSFDPALQGLETSRLVITDITFGVSDQDRLIVVREPDGTLKEAEPDVRNRMNQLYFPKEHRSIKPPRLFEDANLEDLLSRKEYEFILNCNCVQFEPNDPEYQRISSIVYQHINDNSDFEWIRSTRHFGPLAFFLCWHKNIDNLLIELIETAHIEEANSLVALFGKINNINLPASSKDTLDAIEKYIKEHSVKKGPLELALQTYKELDQQKKELEQGIKTAHGVA